MGTTVNGLPFPEGTDRVADGDNAMKALAEEIDAKALFTGDTGWLSAAAAGFVPASANWINLTGTCRRRNGLVAVNFGITSKVAIGSGNITNIGYITVPAGWRPYLNSPVHTSSAGPGHFSYASGGALNSVGSIVLSATVSGISANATVTVGGMWMLPN